MPTSQNGYPAGDARLVSTRQVPGSQVRLTVRNGPAGDLLLYAAGRWDREVEDIDNAPGALDDWGYAVRPIRGSTELSNHASGTAIDLNASRHPLGADPARSFTPGQIAAIHRIIADCDGCLRWGGDYVGRKDGMHVEVVAPEDRCAAVLAHLTEEDDLPSPQDIAKAVWDYQLLNLNKQMIGAGVILTASEGRLADMQSRLAQLTADVQQLQAAGLSAAEIQDAVRAALTPTPSS